MIFCDVTRVTVMAVTIIQKWRNKEITMRILIILFLAFMANFGLSS